MQMRTLWLPIILILVGLNGCGEIKEKTSDQKILLNEQENELPKSILKDADKSIEKMLINKLPEIKSFSKLTKTINKTKNNFQVKNIEWTSSKTKVTIYPNREGGIIWYKTYYKCTSGFFFCKSGHDVDHRFKLKDRAKDKEYIFDHVDGYPREIHKKNKEGKSYTEKREKVKTKYNKNYILVFNNIPLSALRYFDIYEDYCTNNRDSWNVCNIKIKYFNEELQEQDEIIKFLKNYRLETISIKSLEIIYNKYAKYDKVKNLIADNIFIRIKQKNSIEELHKFNHDFHIHKNLVKTAIKTIYELIKIKDSVAGYEWFIKNYSKSEFSKNALERIHEIMFQKAKIVDTISAYNSFIYSYPTAKQVTEANRLANEKERKIYTDLGLMSFWDTDHKKDKKSRQLLIKAKQIERFLRDNNLRGNRAAGYFIVANRMYQLLQEEFNDSDATLRYLESQEFKDFVKDFKNIMSDIKYTLEKINKNTSDTGYYVKELINVSQQGFDDAKADRAMTAYHAKKHTEWEKRMHFQDKGYQ